MRSYVNDKRVNQKKARHVLGTTVSMSLILMLILTTVIVVTYPLVSASAASGNLQLYITIGLGLLATIVGLRSGSRIRDIPVPHEALNNGLRGISNESVIYHYFLPAEHVLITPNGVYSLTTREQKTNIIFDGKEQQINDSFTEKLSRTLTWNAIGHPLIDTAVEADRLAEWVNEHLPKEEISVQPALVFINADAEIEVQGDTSVPVLRADKRKPSLKAYIKEQEQTSTTNISSDLVETINATLQIEP